MNKKNREIAQAIIKAQIASDGGKYTEKYYDYQRSNYGVFEQGYDQKDYYILMAIRKILKMRNSDFRFFVKRTKINDWNSSILVYFNFKIDGKRKQISFHSFSEELEKYISNSKKNKITWDKRDSRETTEELFHYIC